MAASPRLEQEERQEYSEFEFEDSPQHEPLLADHQSDEESSLDDEQKQYKLPSEGGTIFSSFVKIHSMQLYERDTNADFISKLNMANSIIGAGIIGLPFAFKEAVNIYL